MSEMTMGIPLNQDGGVRDLFHALNILEGSYFDKKGMTREEFIASLRQDLRYEPDGVKQPC